MRRDRRSWKSPCEFRTRAMQLHLKGSAPCPILGSGVRRSQSEREMSLSRFFQALPSAHPDCQFAVRNRPWHEWHLLDDGILTNAGIQCLSCYPGVGSPRDRPFGH
jgi:hypothetical protein